MCVSNGYHKTSWGIISKLITNFLQHSLTVNLVEPHDSQFTQYKPYGNASVFVTQAVTVFVREFCAPSILWYCV